MCSHCTKPGYRVQNCSARMNLVIKLFFLALHRANPLDNSAYIVQQLGSKHGTSHHFSYGQLNGRFNVADYTSSTAMEVHRPAASTPSASSTTAVTTTTTSRYRSTTRTTTTASSTRPVHRSDFEFNIITYVPAALPSGIPTYF